MNMSTQLLSDASKELLCDLVDNSCALNISAQPRIVISAYCAVFLPWGFLSLLDMINQRWKTIRRVFVQATFQIVIAIPTIAYTLYYIELQRADRDYKEMCAAIVAVCLFAFHVLRTAWGLWQAYWYWKWVKRCLVHLNQHGYRLEHIEEDFEHVGKYHRKSGLPYHKRLTRLSLSMYVNNSMIDNEFQDCDVPFQFNYSKLFRPHKWFSSEDPWCTPRRFLNSSVRYMVPFLAQFGRTWLQDCDRVKTMVGKPKEDSNSVFFKTYAMKHAKMVTTACSCESNEERMTANWSSTWATILLYQDTQNKLRYENRMGMPFGGEEVLFRVGETYTSYESQIQRLVEELPEDLFTKELFGILVELDLEWKDRVKDIQGISGFHLECFALFLHSKVQNVVNPIGEKPPETPSSEAMASHPPEQAQVGTNEIPGSVSFPEQSRTDLQTHSANANDEYLDTFLPVFEDMWEMLLEGASDEASRESNNDTDMIGNNEDLQATEVYSRDDSELGETREWDAEEMNFGTWSLERAIREKHARLWDSWVMLDDYFKGYSERGVIEFTIHLENVFTLVTNFRGKAASGKDRKIYYQMICDSTRPIRRVSGIENVTPRCEVQQSFWRLWNLPKRVPPTLADIDLESERLRGNIKFIGYIMETVRDCLAKWTEGYMSNDIDTSVWSPEIEADDAHVEFDASIELSCVILDNGLTFLPMLFTRLSFSERMLWECQNHLLGLADNDNSENGPSDVKLILLCMLGFPTQKLRPLHHSDLREGVVVESGAPLEIRVTFRETFREDGERIVKIQMTIVPRGEESGSFTFNWATWIHDFEACMSVLRYEYEEDDLQPVATLSTSGESSEAHCSDDVDSEDVDDDVGNSREEIIGIGDNEARESVGSGERDMEGDASLRASTTAELDEDDVSGEEGDEDGVEVCSGCSCGRKYRLNTKATRVLIEDRLGAEKYYWEWEGWRPQPAFEKGRYPMLHDRERAMERTDSQVVAAEGGSGVDGRPWR